MTILAIRYIEPSYAETERCIEATGLPVVYVDRRPAGIGSLAEAINRGVSQIDDELIWIVTNVTFAPDVPQRLVNNIGNAAAIHPTFTSDHPFLRVGEGIKPVPFVEFTAPLIRKSMWIPLDEHCPYWGMDLDHGYQCWEKGYGVLCDHTTSISHVYIRNSHKHPVTRRRLLARRNTDAKTKEHLQRKYGEKWRDVLNHKSKDIGEFVRLIASKYEI